MSRLPRFARAAATFLLATGAALAGSATSAAAYTSLRVSASNASGPQTRPEARSPWRAATPDELEAALPARAPVEKERIETEMRTATGIVDEHGRMIAAVVLITAGYAADGKYSHFLLVQSPVTIDHTPLQPGAYVVGWTRAQDGLSVRVFAAGTGVPVASLMARPLAGVKRVESFRIWPPGERPILQIGRYMLPYSLPPR